MIFGRKHTVLSESAVKKLMEMSTEFKFKHNEMLHGFQYVAMFPNRYGISIIKHDYSYGNEDDLFEIAVLDGYDGKYVNICYDTPITDDVIGSLKEEEVLKIAKDISELQQVLKEDYKND